MLLYLCTDTVISLCQGRFYTWCAKNSSSYWEYRYIEDRRIGVLSHTFYGNFCRDMAYLSLYRGYCYIEDRCIGVPLYNGLRYGSGCDVWGQFFMHRPVLLLRIYWIITLSIESGCATMNWVNVENYKAKFIMSKNTAA